MKSIDFNLRCRVILAVFVLVTTACSKREITGNKSIGQLNLTLGISVATHNVYSQVKAADLDNFNVIIYSEQGEPVMNYDRAIDLPDAIDLEEGSYYVVAHSDNNLPAAFANDYYSGQSEVFQITGGQSTTVSLTCTLANIMLTVVYSQSVIDDFSDFHTTVSNSTGSLVFNKNETRAGYFNQGPLEIEAVLEYSSATGIADSVMLNGNIVSPEPGKHYEIHIDAALNEGSTAINLSVDESYVTEVITLNQDTGNGNLLITEIMFNPTSLSDTDGEWFEVFNNSGEAHNLRNLVIRRGSNNALHVINADLVLAAGAYAVLGRTANATNDVDYVYGSSISLGNTGENLIINTFGTSGTDGTIICSVDYGAAGFSTSISGASLQLTAGINNAASALLGSNWCASTTAYNTGDLGTPGTANLQCH